jgi:hypothetical protein
MCARPARKPGSIGRDDGLVPLAGGYGGMLAACVPGGDM